MCSRFGQPSVTRRSLKSAMNFSMSGICSGKIRAWKEILPSGFRPAPGRFPPRLFLVSFMAAILAAASFDFNEIIKAQNTVSAGLTDTLYTPAKSNIIKARGFFIQKAQSYANRLRTLKTNRRAKFDPEAPVSALIPPIKTRQIAFYAQVFCRKPFETAKTA